MSVAALETIAQEIEQLGPDEKLTLLSLLVDSLRRQVAPPGPSLMDYYGVGKGRSFRTAAEVDAYIDEERASWESPSGNPEIAST
jgi:hypothetical protein